MVSVKTGKEELPEGSARFSSAPELADPGRFVRRAALDLRFALRIAPTIVALRTLSRRRASILGALWVVLPMFGTAAIGFLLQSRPGLALPSVGMPYPVFIAVGVSLWQIFMEAMNLALHQLNLNRHALTRLRMPVEAALIAGLIELMVHTGVRIALLAALLAVLGVTPGASLAFLPVALIGLAALGLSIGMILAPLGLLVEDVGRAMLILGGIWLAASPVFYDSSSVEMFRWNPVSPMLNAARDAMTGHPVGPIWGVAVLCVLSLVPAWLFLRVARPQFIGRLA